MLNHNCIQRPRFIGRSSSGAIQHSTVSTTAPASAGRPSGAAGPPSCVVDFSYGFTDPRYPTGADMTGAAATARLLEAARAAGRAGRLHHIAYDRGQGDLPG